MKNRVKKFLLIFSILSITALASACEDWDSQSYDPNVACAGHGGVRSLRNDDIICIDGLYTSPWVEDNANRTVK